MPAHSECCGVGLTSRPVFNLSYIVRWGNSMQSLILSSLTPDLQNVIAEEPAYISDGVRVSCGSMIIAKHFSLGIVYPCHMY